MAIANALVQETFVRIASANRLLIVMHKNPDGDTLGCAVALFHILAVRNLQPMVFCATKPSRHFSYLRGFDRVQTDADAAVAYQPDAVVVFDASDIEYSGAGEVLARLAVRPCIINIDHHATNAGYGDLNIVDGDASSTAEVLYRCVRQAGWKIPRDAASAFLAGLITDTGAFSNLGTTTGSLLAAADLVAAGAKSQPVIKHYFQNKSLPALRLWGEAFQRLKKHKKLGWVVTVLTREDFKKFGAQDEDTDGLSNFLNSLTDAEALVLLVERNNGTIDGSLRTTRPEVDVARVARLFGGGGHKKAAGFTIPGRLIRSGDSWRIIKNVN